MSRRVLILGGRAPVALDHARRFHRHGWQVHVADSIPCRLSGASAAVHARHAIAPARHAPQRFVADLQRLLRDARIDLLLPTCEEALHLARHRPALPASLQVAVDDFEQLAALHSKGRFVELARQHGMPVPDSVRVHGLDAARAWAGARAVVLKPEYSRFGVHVRLHPDGIPADAPPLPVAGPWIVQALLRGEELCSYAIAHRGRLLADACYRPRWRLGRSSSFYFEPVEHAGLRASVAALVAGLGYSGQISFDWIVGDDGIARALECNPRATSGLHLFDADADLPAALLGERDVGTASGGPRMLAPVMAGAGLLQALRHRRLARWRNDWQRATDVITAPGDRAPLTGAVADLAAYTGLAVRQGCSLRQAATHDIEWDGEALETVPP